MNFLDWMNMNMLVDITFLVFATASIWKIRSLQNKISNNEKEVKESKNGVQVVYQNQKEIHKVIKVFGEDLKLVMKNPQAARRLLKEREQ